MSQDALGRGSNKGGDTVPIRIHATSEEQREAFVNDVGYLVEKLGVIPTASILGARAVASVIVWQLGWKSGGWLKAEPRADVAASAFREIANLEGDDAARKLFMGGAYENEHGSIALGTAIKRGQARRVIDFVAHYVATEGDLSTW